MISAIGFNKMIHYKIIIGSCNGEIFLEFIKELFNKISMNQKWSLHIDNARIHYYWKFKNYINKRDNIKHYL